MELFFVLMVGLFILVAAAVPPVGGEGVGDMIKHGLPPVPRHHA